MTRRQNSSYLCWRLLKPGYQLPHKWRQPLRDWLSEHPELRAINRAKEKLSRFYRIASRQQAFRELTRMTDEWATSELSELQTLREALLKWRNFILNFWGVGSPIHHEVRRAMQRNSGS